MTDIDGTKAEILLQNPVFNKAVDELRDEIFRDWAKTAPDDREKRETLYFELRGMAAAVTRLNAFIVRAEREKKHGRS